MEETPKLFINNGMQTVFAYLFMKSTGNLDRAARIDLMNRYEDSIRFHNDARMAAEGWGLKKGQLHSADRFTRRVMFLLDKEEEKRKFKDLAKKAPPPTTVKALPETEKEEYFDEPNDIDFFDGLNDRY